MKLLTCLFVMSEMNDAFVLHAVEHGWTVFRNGNAAFFQTLRQSIDEFVCRVLISDKEVSSGESSRLSDRPCVASPRAVEHKSKFLSENDSVKLLSLSFGMCQYSMLFSVDVFQFLLLAWIFRPFFELVSSVTDGNLLLVKVFHRVNGKSSSVLPKVNDQIK